MEYILTQPPKEIVEDAITAAMMTKRIPEDFKISAPALEVLHKTIETFIERKDAEGIYTMVVTYLVAYSQGYLDGEHPHKNFTKYSDFPSE